MDKVCVFMSTYNGGKYIQKQLVSILKQKNVEVLIIIRDDGSTDNTVDIVKMYINNYSNIVLLEGENLGCEKSFEQLLHTEYNADYYAFADQDDYWMPNKLIQSIKLISNESGPALSATNLQVCDENLVPIKIIHSKQDLKYLEKRKKEDFLCNMHGCVLLWNAALQSKIKMHRTKMTFAHDVWVCSIANAIGVFKISDVPEIYYRLHENNVSGFAFGILQRLKKGINLYLGNGHPKRDLIAQELLNAYQEDMDISSIGYKNLKLLSNYKHNLKSKIEFIKSSMMQNYKMPDKFFWIVCVILGTY